jgi:alpha-L-fucosidase
MLRRSTSFLISACITILASRFDICVQPQNFADVKPSPQQIAWQDLEFGVIIHFSTNTFVDREWGDGTADPKVFDPTEFDAEQWMRAIQAAGGKVRSPRRKAHDGFCLWPTQQTDYSVKASPWKNGQGDMVMEVSQAARKYGLKFGIYLSPWDRHDPRYSNSVEYDKYYVAELSELAQRYWLKSQIAMPAPGPTSSYTSKSNNPTAPV